MRNLGNKVSILFPSHVLASFFPNDIATINRGIISSSSLYLTQVDEVHLRQNFLRYGLCTKILLSSILACKGNIFMGPIVLAILDGWGITREKTGNAILAAKTPNYHLLSTRFLNSQLQASGEHVGLPKGLMGNSEVGHLTIGAGRIVTQKLTLISNTIEDGTFFQNPVLVEAIENVRKSNGKLHVLGLVSDGCVHSSPDHLDGLLELAKRSKVKNLVIHPILDGRDTPPRSAGRFMKELEGKLQGVGQIGVVCGRYYAMDRDQRWERTEKYYRALTLSEGIEADSAIEAVEASYKQEIGDEFVLPHIVSKAKIEDGDSVICFNFRPDRVRQISRVLTAVHFEGFERPLLPKIYYACLTEYDKSLNLPVAFNPEVLPNQDLHNTLPEIISCHHLDQFHTAETEKYAHVTYFLNGGKEAPVEGETRQLIPSLKVATYDLAPSMRTPQVCELTCQAINSGKHPFIVLNFANPDMVGHTGIMDAAVPAVKSVDEAFGILLSAVEKANGTLFVTADHGNIEQLIDYKTGEPHTAHTTNPVPFIVASFQKPENDPLGLRSGGGARLLSGGLADVAPTILASMGINKPEEMTGHNLICKA
jgi:2,3-bisphosphoglycerate-independent phosphoglycerate mutase